jgi:predicted nucleic acid-binding protein
MQIKRKTIFVDTSAFILFLHNSCSDIAKEIFRTALNGECKLVTSSRCIDELIFKEMVLLAKSNYNLANKTVEKLRKKPEIVKKLGRKLKEVIPKFLKTYKVEIIQIKTDWVIETPQIMESFGIFGNDALIVRAMQSRNLKYLLSADSDFEKISFIELIKAK